MLRLFLTGLMVGSATCFVPCTPAKLQSRFTGQMSIGASGRGEACLGKPLGGVAMQFWNPFSSEDKTAKREESKAKLRQVPIVCVNRQSSIVAGHVAIYIYCPPCSLDMLLANLQTKP